MKKLLKIIIIFLLLFGGINIYNATSFKLPGIEDGANSKEIPYCKNEKDCGLNKGIEGIKEIKDIETGKTASVYIQDIVSYLLTFITVIAVIYIIYAGFIILIGGGDEEKIKDSKKIIMYVVLGMLIIYLAAPIIGFILNMLG